jgi:protein-tyrosine phosphatase
MKVDIHNHILWNIDDGPKEISETIEMVKNAVAQGITHVIATPHYKKGILECEFSVILDMVNKVNQLLQNENIPLSISAGMEIQLYRELSEDLVKGNSLFTLNGNNKFVLVELPNSYIPTYTEQVFFEMQLNGFIPILAHPERNMEFIRDPNKLINLVQKGTLVQISARSLLPKHNRKIANFAHQMMKHRIAHLVSSDAHDTNNRPFLLNDVYTSITKKYGKSYTSYLTKNATHVFFGEEFSIHPPIPVKKFLNLF